MSGILGIDMGAHQIRIVHGAVAGEVLRVFDFATEDNLTANRENAVQQLEELIARKGFQSCPVALALSGPGVVHRLQDFPKMPLDELGVVVQREMRTLSGGEEVALDWEVIDEAASGDLKQLKVLVAMAPRLQVDEARQLLDQCHLQPSLITTSPTSLLSALKLVQGGGIGQLVFLYLGGEEGYLLGTDDGVWSFYREFSSRSSEGGMDFFVGEAMREAHRALLYHRQRFPEGKEIQFLLAGERGLEELKERLEKETGCEGEVVSPGTTLDLSPLKERADTFHDQFPSFVISLGLVAAANVKSGINLIPEAARRSVRRWPSIDWTFVYRPVSVLVVLVILAAFHFMVLRVETHYEVLLAERRALHTQWLPAIQAAQESRGLREGLRLLEQSIGSSQVKTPSWVGLFKALGRMAPPDLILSHMKVEKAQENWHVNLKGEVISSDAYTAQVAFNGFYRGLKESLGLDQMELLPLRMSTFTVEGEDPPEVRSEDTQEPKVADRENESLEIKKTKIEFEVRGQLREF